MDIEKCENCKYYLAGEYEQDGIEYEQTYGICRRYPPRRIDGVNSANPFVEDEWWCGEYVNNGEND